MKKIIAIAIAAFSMQVYAEIKGIPATEIAHLLARLRNSQLN